ncbi:MAG: tetraacyldisaccharide 4'-kinase [Hyphomicrobiales bacterium]|nr:tetraacyldisaccharide 4'-kinase [Hyphomicrobiales bacterium]
MRTPGFWWRAPGLEARLLQPIGAVYGAVTAQRMTRRGVRSELPVLCVGNFVAGGSGKTPFAIELGRHLVRMGENPAFLTRGYGGKSRGPTIVDPARHKVPEVGDEALLLARHAITIVAKTRSAGARLAEHAGASVIVLDDGLQNSSLAKDFSFAIVDGETAIGNGLCVPSGPLRAPLAAQWPFVHAIVTVGSVGAPCRTLIEEARGQGISTLRARLVPDPEVVEALRGRTVVAFAGIGRPEKFFASLRAIGAVLVAEHGFGDHHRFTVNELRALAAEAGAHDAILVTTEKDMVRVRDVIAVLEGARNQAHPQHGHAVAPAMNLRELPVRMHIEQETELDKLVARALFVRRGARLNDG